MIDNDLIINITSGEICWFYIFQNKSLGTDLGVTRDRSWSHWDRVSLTYYGIWWVVVVKWWSGYF